MILPGKLSLGYLQEDNPLKFYFRVSPLLIKDENECLLVENAAQEYLEDGFIRIVPDKNEISHFKTRMRALGRYCLLDLRRHTGENDKIRPNKNHVGENGDRNAFIVYSDVITALPPLFMAEAVEPDQDGLFPRPGTRLVAVMQDGAVVGVYAWQERDEAACVTGSNLARADLADAAGKLLPFNLDGQPVRLLLDLAAWQVAAPQEPAPQEPEAVRPAAPIRAAAPVHPAEPEPEQPAEVRPEPQEKPPEKETVPAEPKEQPAEAPDDKPWLQHTTFVFPRAVSAKLTPRRQSMMMQSGFNPRRGAGIKDIIDDMWRQSRLDQLGHPVPPKASGTPVVSPVDSALEAVREAWKLPEARASLVSGLLKLDELDAALGANGQPNAARTREERDHEQQLSRFEVERLRLLCEIDELKKMRADKRTELIDELKQARAGEMAQIEKKNKALAEAQQKYAAEAESARNAAEAASKAFGEVSKSLDERLAQQLADSRARDLMIALARSTRQPRILPQTEEFSAGELIAAMRVRFGEAGVELSNDEAVNLMACVALGRVIVVSGPTGSGKSHYVRALAAALGVAAPEYGRFAEMQPDETWRSLGRAIEDISGSGVPLVRMPAVRQVLETADDTAPALLMLDDANRVPVDRYLGELLSQLDPDASGRLATGAEPIALGGALRLILTVQDAGGGAPIGLKLLDRAWLMRLSPEKADSAWHPRGMAMPAPERAVSMQTLKKVFDTARDVPGEITERMKQLRAKLAEAGVLISRRALDDMYGYCAAVSPLMTCSPVEVLDYAFAQRAMPAILAGASLDALHALPSLLPDMPRSLSLLVAPLPLPPL
ncbi:MAG: hypothetical protein J5602_01215 [Clostridia bacterium]|nr:hypothetical protein [Clostridia bacterium]